MSYATELGWDPKDGSQRDGLHLLVNRQDRPTLHMLPTTLLGALMTELGCIHVAVALKVRQLRFVARQATVC